MGRSLALCAVFLAWAPGLARADGASENDKETARTAAKQGSAAFDERRYAEALELFKRAESLLHAPTHLLMIARTNVELGNLVSARERYRELLDEPLPEGAPPAFKKAQDAARAELSALERRIPTVEIGLDPPDAATLRDLTVTADDKAVPVASLDKPTAIDPGLHTFRATAQGVAPAESSVMVKEGQRASVRLHLEAPAAGRPPPAVGGRIASTPTKPDRPSTDASGPSMLRPLSIIAMGVGVVGLGLGTGFAIAARSNVTDADDTYAKCGQPCPPGKLADEVRRLDDVVGRDTAISATAFIAGGILAIGGLALFLVDRSSRAQNSPSVTSSARTPWEHPRAPLPWFTNRGAGFSGRF